MKLASTLAAAASTTIHCIIGEYMICKTPSCREPRRNVECAAIRERPLVVTFTY
jgi:hypothetical protein